MHMQEAIRSSRPTCFCYGTTTRTSSPSTHMVYELRVRSPKEIVTTKGPVLLPWIRGGPDLLLICNTECDGWASEYPAP